MRPAKASFRLEMLQVARLAPNILGDSAELVKKFLQSQSTSAGAFGDREGRADLYYTVFGLEAMSALQSEVTEEGLLPYLRSFAGGEGLDFVHLCSLARCAANVSAEVFTRETKQEIASRIETYRTPDGGFHGTPGKSCGSAYGNLLAWGAYSDLGLEMPQQQGLAACVMSLATADGGFANEPGLPLGTTTATAAAVTLCRFLAQPIPPETGQWLLRQCHPSGGFLAAPGAPLPDLLSTAVALHALDGLEVSFSHLKELCLDFVDTLWSAEGGFHGHWADEHVDVEYTYYGLLSLGHLSL